MTESADISPSATPPPARSAGSASIATTTPGAVLITGICGRLGKHLARVLHRERRVVGVDRRPFADKPKDVEHAAGRHPAQEAQGRLPRRRHRGGGPPRRHARPARLRRGAPLVERRRLHEAPRVRRAVPGPEARRPLERQRLRPAAEQPAVPHRGGAAARRRRTSATSATSSRSTCSRRASSGSCPRPRRSSCGRCTSSGAVHNAPSNFLRLNADPDAHGLRPDGAGHPRKATSCTPSGSRSRPGIRGIFNVAGPEPVPLSRVIKILGRQRISVPYSLAQRRPAPHVVAAPDDVPRRPSSITSATCAWSTTGARARCSATRRGPRSRRRSAPSTRGGGDAVGTPRARGWPR